MLNKNVIREHVTFRVNTYKLPTYGDILKQCASLNCRQQVRRVKITCLQLPLMEIFAARGCHSLCFP